MFITIFKPIIDIIKYMVKTKKSSLGTGATPHGAIRNCNKWCNKKDHNHSPVGNAHRSHGTGSYKKLHHNYYDSKGNMKPTIKNRLKLYARKYRAKIKKRGKK